MTADFYLSTSSPECKLEITKDNVLTVLESDGTSKLTQKTRRGNGNKIGRALSSDAE